jgi:hypothetical protein
MQLFIVKTVTINLVPLARSFWGMVQDRRAESHAPKLVNVRGFHLQTGRANLHEPPVI